MAHKGIYFTNLYQWLLLIILIVFAFFILILYHWSSQPYSILATSPLDLVNDLALDDPSPNICTFYLRKNKNPNFEHYHFYHDMECILSAFHYQSFIKCQDINMIVSDQYNYSKSVYRQIFNFTIIDRDEFNNNSGSHYGCQRGKTYMYEMKKYRDYIVNKFKLNNQYNMGYDSKSFYETYGDILIINRQKFRHIHNVDELRTRLQMEFKNTSHEVRMVYFDKMPLLEQYQNILNATVIITPHGAAEVNWMMVNYLFVPSVIKLIELCPPYTHCWLSNDNGGKRVNLCPHYYNQVFKYFLIYAVAREDKQLGNCSVFWDYHNEIIKNNTKRRARNFKIDFKRINGFKVAVDGILNAIHEPYSRKHAMYIDQASFEETERMYYKSTVSLVDKHKREVFELYPSL
eukprot:190605_1